MSRLRALVVLSVLILSLLPGRASATPVCTDGYKGGPPLELCGGRVFPEAANTLDYVQYLPDPVTGFAEYQHGLEYLAQLYPRWISVFTLREHFEDDPAVSVGPDGKRSSAADDTGDGHDIVVVKITDHEVPDDGKETLLYSLSIHGDEKGGIEGGVRAAEDLVVAAEEGGSITDGIAGYESTTGRQPDFRSYPVSEVLANEVVYLVDFNIDGWRRGDHFAPTPGLYTRGNQLGVDLNRQMPTVGYINPGRNPLQESEMFYGHAFMHEVAEAGVGDRMAYGADVHGEGQSRAWVDIMYPAGQFDSVKHRRLMSIAERTKSVIDDSLFFGVPNAIEEATGGDGGEGLEEWGAPKNTIPTKPARWGTVWDTLGYTDTGFLGDYMAEELGVTGMDYEIAWNHADLTRPYGRPWGVILQENYINATRSIIKTAMAYAMTEREDFADFQIDPGGRVGYVFNPDTITDSDEDGSGRLPGPNANGIGADGQPVVQRPYEATNMQFFEDENDYVVGGLNKALPADIASDPGYLDQFDSLVIADIALPADAAGRPVDPAAYYDNLRTWVERGGNLVLTDRALHSLTEMSVLAPGAVTDVKVYQPYSNIADLGHPMVEGLRSNARQLSEATLIGHGIGNNASPMTVVTRSEWEAAGGHTVGTTGNNSGSSDSGTQTSVGELPVGEGLIRIMGGGLAMPTEQNDHRYGLKDYSLTYSGLFIIENSLRHDHPDLGNVATAAPTVLDLVGPASGQYTDEVSLSATLLAGDVPVADSPITFELWNDSARESWTGTTDENGHVTIPARLLVEPGQYMLTARYEGAADAYEPSADVQDFVVEKEDTVLSLALEGRGSNASLTAVLTDADDPATGVADRVVTVFANGDQIGTLVTDGSGTATMEVPSRYRGRKTVFEAVFDAAGDGFWRGSTATAGS